MFNLNKAMPTCYNLLAALGLAIVCSVAYSETLALYGVNGGTYAVPVTSMKGLRFKATLRQQYDFSCGSAAVATLLTHQYAYPVTEQTVFQEMYSRGDQDKIHKEGFSLLDIKRYLANHGFKADAFRQPLEKLEQAGLPAIVLINDKGYHHFVVVKGIRSDRVLLGDPATGTRAVSRSSFEAMWLNQLLFVVHNRKEQARFNLTDDWNAVPRAPLADGIRRDGLELITLPKLGSGDF